MCRIKKARGLSQTAKKWTEEELTQNDSLLGTLSTHQVNSNFQAISVLFEGQSGRILLFIASIGKASECSGPLETACPDWKSKATVLAKVGIK